jgi:hypothetical protein
MFWGFTHTNASDNEQSAVTYPGRITLVFIELSLKLVRIRVIRVFTVAFPRRVFGRRDRRAMGPKGDRALEVLA